MQQPFRYRSSEQPDEYPSLSPCNIRKMSSFDSAHLSPQMSSVPPMIAYPVPYTPMYHPSHHAPPHPSMYPGYFPWMSPQTIPHHRYPPVEYITDLRPNDVLSGRGGATNTYRGNREFRILVKENQERYLRAKKRDKPSVACEIVQVIRQRGGRFLRRVNEKVVNAHQVFWLDIGDDRAREKTCQALREGAPELRRQQAQRSESMSDDEKSPSSAPFSASASPRDDVIVLASSTSFESNTSKSSWMHSTEQDVPARSLVQFIEPCNRLLFKRRSVVRPISLSSLSDYDRELYLQDFYPPN